MLEMKKTLIVISERPAESSSKESHSVKQRETFDESHGDT
jgi:hypothetical protein